MSTSRGWSDGREGTFLKQPRVAQMAAVMADVDTGGIEVADDPVSLARAAVGNVCAEATPSFDPAEQLAELERDGVYGAVLISRIHGFDAGTPPEVDVAYCQIVNDWLAETWGAVPRPGRAGLHPPVPRHGGVGEGVRTRGGDGVAAGAASGWHLRPPVLTWRSGSRCGRSRTP